MTSQAPPQEPDIEFALPGKWASLELRGGPDAVARRIRRMAAAITGPRDELAQLRHDLRSELTAVAERAADVKADQVHLARSLVGDIPFPASLIISRPGVALPHTDGLAAANRQLAELIPGDERGSVEHPQLAMARSVDRAGGTDDAANPFHLTATYWIQLPDDRLCTFTFTVAVAGLDNELLTLFDAIIQSVVVRNRPSDT